MLSKCIVEGNTLWMAKSTRLDDQYQRFSTELHYLVDLTLRRFWLYFEADRDCGKSCMNDLSLMQGGLPQGWK